MSDRCYMARNMDVANARAGWAKRENFRFIQSERLEMVGG